MNFLKNNLIGIIILIFAFFYVLHSINAPFIGDGWKILTANKIIHSGSIGYWFELLTSPHHGNVQYRPLSIFIYPFFFDYIAHSSSLVYNIVGITLFIISVLVQYKLAKELIHNNVLIVFSTFLFITHHATDGLLHEMTNHMKYFPPLIILTYLVLRNFQLEYKTLKQNIKVMLVLFISLLFHEGSLTFGIILLLQDVFLKRKISINRIIILIPLFFYLLIRVFVFKIPSSGFMKIEFIKIFETYSFFHFHLWSSHINNIISNNIIICYFSLISFLSISIFLYFKGKRTVFIILGITICTLLPFSLLSKHLVPDRVIWGTPFMAIFLPLLLDQIKNKKNVLVPSIIILFFVLSFQNYQTKFQHIINFNDPYKIGTNQFLKQLEDSFLSIPQNKIIKLKINAIENIWAERTVFAGMIASTFKNHTFWIPQDPSRELAFEHFIFQGAYYYSKSPIRLNQQQIDVIDPYDQELKIKNPILEKEIIEVEFDLTEFGKAYSLTVDMR